MNEKPSRFSGLDHDDRRFFRRALIVFGLFAMAYFFWLLAGTLLLVFAAILIAVILRAFSFALERHAHVPRAISFYIALLVVGVALAGFVYFFGAQLQTQLTDLLSQLPEQIDGFAARLGIEDPLSEIESQLDDGFGASLFGQAAGFGYTVIGGFTNLLLLIVAAIYLAYDPKLYRKLFASLFPPDQRHGVEDVMLATGAALKKWFLGQMVSMLFVGLLSGLGYWAVGLPTPAALGLIAGFTNFIPYIGPVLGAVPALVFGFNISLEMTLYALLVAFAVQQLEGNVLVPLIQKRAVAMPPAVALFAIIIFGVLFGFIGILLAVPLAVTVMILVRKLWIEGVVEHPPRHD
ncbi:AI-2E family transporter [Saliniramus sp.]|uniref:AI-2E family transporter n=1 Tax=Saliniramus sp. TaxID=2986772 RepID=UPI002B835B4A|nr:AI-2E family transporter [Saliniramus sp.]HMB09342.1 AI-2E family transporter [Saliniramus sp.]